MQMDTASIFFFFYCTLLQFYMWCFLLIFLLFSNPFLYPFIYSERQGLKTGGTRRLSTDLVQSCSSADVTWAWVWRQQQLTLHVKIFQRQILIRCQKLVPVDRQPPLTHRLQNVPVILIIFFFLFPFWVGKDGGVCTWTCCSFLRSVSNPKLFTVFSKFEHNNKAEETEFSEHASVTRIISGRFTHQLQLISSFIQCSADQKCRGASSQIT